MTNERVPHSLQTSSEPGAADFIDPGSPDEIAAIHVDRARTELRHGGLHIVRQTFKGFVALPAPEGAMPWREVLGLAGPVTVAEIDRAYRDKAATAHPDKGGSSEAMQQLNRARTEAKAAIQ